MMIRSVGSITGPLTVFPIALHFWLRESKAVFQGRSDDSFAIRYLFF